jgi:hypothetical protein
MDGIPSFVFLIVVLAFLAIGGGLLIWLIGFTKDEDEQEAQQSQEVRRPATVEPATKPKITAPVTGGQELLRVSRTDTGELGVFVQGQRYYHLRGIRDPQVGRETVEAIKAVMAFTEGLLPALRKDAPQPAPMPSTVDEEEFLERLRQSILFPSEERPPGLLDGLAQRTLLRSAEGALLTPADEIHALVQQRLENLPDLARHNIRVTTAPDGGLSFHVGLEKFDAVEEIPNPGIQALIQDAIREWRESSHRLGTLDNTRGRCPTGSDLSLCIRLGQPAERTPQVAHEAEGVQDPHDAPAPAITPSLPIAENNEIIRPVLRLPHLGQAMGASASDMDLKASKRT